MVEVEKVIDQAAEQIERAQTYSKQPRFEGTADDFWGAIQRWFKLSEDLQIPDYSSKSRTRDKWLQEFWNREPHWAGVISQLTLINSSRGWTLTGGRNQVNRFATMFHNANDGEGWRNYMKQQVLAYYTTDMCAVTELGRDGVMGPLRALYHVDSTECELTSDPDYPLKYYPPRGRIQKWSKEDFFRVVSNPNQQAKFNGLGFCATSMAYELVKILYAVWMHDQEQTGARMPEGLMLLEGISSDQWEDALNARKAQLDGDLRRYFGGLFVFFSEGLEQMDAKLIALSALPENFDRKIFTDQTIYAYSMIVGIDAQEFWPVQYGALGRGTEVEVQHRKATTKGSGDFTSALQERLQAFLPDTLLFQFEQRDAEGEIIDAEIAQAWATVAKTLYQAGAGFEGGEPLLTKEQCLTMLVQKGVIPPEWSAEEEPDVATDLTRFLDYPEIHRAIQTFNEPIVRYQWPSGQQKVIWSPEAHKKYWQFRQKSPEDEILFESEDVVITMQDVLDSIDEAARRVEPDFSSIMKAETE